MIMACYSGSIQISQMLRSWLIVFIGNLIGAIAIVMLVFLSGHWLHNQGAVGRVALEIAATKTSLSFTEALPVGCSAIFSSVSRSGSATAPAR